MQFDLKQFLRNGREPWRQAFELDLSGADFPGYSLGAPVRATFGAYPGPSEAELVLTVESLVCAAGAWRRCVSRCSLSAGGSSVPPIWTARSSSFPWRRAARWIWTSWCIRSWCWRSSPCCFAARIVKDFAPCADNQKRQAAPVSGRPAMMPPQTKG